MKNLIYQYWDGPMNSGTEYGRQNMKEYAERIGADYVFEENPCWRTDLGRYSPHYGGFKPLYVEEYQEYNNVLYADADVFAVDGLEESIFDGFSHDVGICEETFQPEYRGWMKGAICRANDERWTQAVDKKWNVSLPRTPEGIPRVFNSGVVLWSNAGMAKARERFVPFKEFVDFVAQAGCPSFYGADQNYLNAMLEVCDFDWTIMDAGWNEFFHQVRYPDGSHPLREVRNENTKFVHVQLRGADHWPSDKLWKATNRPLEEWWDGET